MTIYGKLTSWDKFKQKLEEVEGASTKSLTDYIDKNLFNGGQIKDLHEKIIAEQIHRGGNRYKTRGYLFNNKGKVQQGTFFGHIAHLIVDEDCIIAIDNIEITKSLSKDFLHSKYDQNCYIRIEAFKGDRRKNSFTNSSSDREEEKFEEAYLPTKEDCDRAIKELYEEGQQGNTKNVLDRIKRNVISQGIKIKSNWRIITEANMKIWSC